MFPSDADQKIPSDSDAAHHVRYEKKKVWRPNASPEILTPNTRRQKKREYVCTLLEAAQVHTVPQREISASLQRERFRGAYNADTLRIGSGSGSGKQRAFATPPADEGSAGCTPEAGRVVPEQPETT